MPLEKDEIVPIPDNRVKFFGGTGKMLLPCPATVAKVLQEVPTGSVVTTSLLCRLLTQLFGVQGTCPVTTKKAIIALAQDGAADTPVWRVINQNGKLMAQFPGGTDVQAARLLQEGLTLEPDGNAVKVKGFKERLFSFAE